VRAASEKREQHMDAPSTNSLQHCWEQWLAAWRLGALIGACPWDRGLRAFIERSELLPRRMATLGLDSDAARVESAKLLELMQHCAACESDEQCEWDLRQDPSNPAWQDYCPNRERLHILCNPTVNVGRPALDTSMPAVP
jgi:hypothetical protein